MGKKIKKDAFKIKEDAEKIKKDAVKIKKENQRLRKQMAKLRRDNSQIKKIQRQIDQYLQVNKICVAGNFSKSVGSSGVYEDHTVDFGHAFPRVPAFTASLSRFRINSVSSYNNLDAPSSVKKITNSSAVIYLSVDSYFGYFSVAWMACL